MSITFSLKEKMKKMDEALKSSPSIFTTLPQMPNHILSQIKLIQEFIDDAEMESSKYKINSATSQG